MRSSHPQPRNALGPPSSRNGAGLLTAPAHSRSVEDYLKAIYGFSETGRSAGTTKLAQVLGVQPASVSGMIRRLIQDGLVEREPYRGIQLTERGGQVARGVVRRHRIIEAFLVQKLDFPSNEVHEEAERLEHAASDRLVERMAAVLGHPREDPHGTPIPEPVVQPG